MVVSLSVMSIVFLSMGSVMMVATTAIPSPDGPINLMLDASDVLNQMASELQVATTVIAVSDKEIVFTVPDRDNDGLDEVIMYRWDGTAGTPFSRKYNDGAYVQLLPAIKGFELTCNTLESSQPGEPVTGSVVLLASHGPAQNSGDFDVDDDNWGGQCFSPQNLPADATSWSVNRVVFNARLKGDTAGITRVQLREAKADHTPESTVLEEHLMYESHLTSSYAWQSFSFNNVTDLAPDEEVCLVIEHIIDVDACQVQYDQDSGGGYIETDNGDDYWEHFGDKSMVYYVFGTYDTPGPPVPVYKLCSVSMTLTPSDIPASQARASVVALNRPQMP